MFMSAIPPQTMLRYPACDGTLRGGRFGNRGGRPRLTGKDAHVPHAPRPALTRHHAVHVTMRLAPGIWSLRRRAAYRAIRRATLVAARKDDVRIVHLSIQRNHLHLLVEAASALALGEGMRRFAISAARQINRVSAHRGRVFADRYHARIIKSPRQARHALAYVLNNWRHHGLDDNHVTKRWLLDRYSSAIYFRGWRGIPETHIWPLPRDYEPLVVQPPASWLLRTGWAQHGPIALDERPGPHRVTD
jgi:REP element-mobilizing transposase RayT